MLCAAMLIVLAACAGEAEQGQGSDPAGGPMRAYVPFPHYQDKSKVLIAHRGASAYAPEHTLEAYRLALQQGADFVEQDFQLTRDGILVCLHDRTLERTTDVEEVFPDRYREENGQRRWFVHDFSLQEIKQLDAGSWFGSEFADARIPTFEEAVQLVRGRAGLFPELKEPAVYREMGLEMERIVLEALSRHGLDRRDSDTPVILQTFDAVSARLLTAQFRTRFPVVLLLGRDNYTDWGSPERLKAASVFVAGIGPNKALIELQPDLVKWAHDNGLSVTPYTFRASDVGKGYDSLQEEMNTFLHQYGVDALFTDNPDLFPRPQER